jgi:hypothetical protein
MTELSVERVECYSGHTYAQEPRAVIWQGRRYPVDCVEQRWRTPEGPAFRVRAEPEGVFDLRYHELEDRWTIQMLPDETSEQGGS